MDDRKVFSLDPSRFPLEQMRAPVTFLHDGEKHYMMMVDPAIAYYNYSAFSHGKEKDVFMKRADGSIYQGRVWPGSAVFS